MRPRERDRATGLETSLRAFSQEMRVLPGIGATESLETFVEQLVESERRVRYVLEINKRDISTRRGDPLDPLFDPLRASILQARARNTEEAFWLVFLFIHFGRSRRGGWLYVRSIYGRDGNGTRWDWPSVSGDPAGFRRWLYRHQRELNALPCGFGNHRKYESLDAKSETGTGAAIESYVRWVSPPRTHEQLVSEAIRTADGDRAVAFDILYRSMAGVRRFGRLARFEYLSMLGKLEFASIEAGSPYLAGASGPRRGAELLFGENPGAATLDRWVAELGHTLGLGMQVMEDAICNWQKSPAKFIAFRG